MTSLPLPLEYDNSKDDRPLPLIVADKWGFHLEYALDEENDRYIYCARDWYIGLGGTKNGWTQFKKDWVSASNPVMMEVKRPRRPIEMMEFVSSNGLYIIAARMTTADDRPQLDEVKQYLAKAGVKMDEYRLNPESAVNDAMGQYHIEGKSDSWVEARIQSVITRKQFTDALKDVVINAPANLYSAGTEQIYAGLWQMTTAQLRGELGLKPKQNVRDAFGEYALIYTRLAEMVSTEQLRNAEIVPMSVAMEIVYKVAGMIRNQAQETARLLGIDLITGRKLLKD